MDEILPKVNAIIFLLMSFEDELTFGFNVSIFFTIRIKLKIASPLKIKINFIFTFQ